MHAYVEPARDGGAELSPLPESEHAQQLQMVRSNQRDNDRLQSCQPHLRGSVRRDAAFVAEFEFTEAKQEACVLLHAALSDANFDAVLAKLRFDAERDAVRQESGWPRRRLRPPHRSRSPPRRHGQQRGQRRGQLMKKKPVDSDEDSD